MPSLTTSAIALFHRFFGHSAEAEHDYPAGVETVLDGNTAVAITEACIAEAAGLGGTFPTEGASFTWKAEQARKIINCLGGTLNSREAEAPRGALAAAIGQTMAGIRTTLFISGPDLASAQDLLVMAAGRHLPLVIHVNNRALAAQGGPLGNGHESCHLSADSGCVVMLAANVQEAVHMTLAARRIAEHALIPVLVAMDGEHTALAPQDVILPPPPLVRSFLGRPDDPLPVTAAAHQLVFGESRRRIPRWHDLDVPVLHGSLQGPDNWAISLAANQVYLQPDLDQIIAQSFELLTTRTGQELNTFSAYRCDDARIVFIVQGAAIETAEAASDHMRKQRIKVGVLGIRCLRPLAERQVANCLRGKSAVAVLECVPTSLANEPPLLREIRALLNRNEAQTPTLRSVIYGLGGLPLRAADLVALGQRLNTQSPRPTDRQIYLGIDFSCPPSHYPKRQVLLDTLRRDYPEATVRGLKSNAPSPDLRPRNALTIAIHRLSGQDGRDLGIDTAIFLQQLLGGQVRSHPCLFWERYASYCVERLTHMVNTKNAVLRDPGADTPVDLTIIAAPQWHRLSNPLDRLLDNGALLFISPLSDEPLCRSLAGTLRRGLQQKQLTLFCAAPGEFRELDPELQKERLLGATIGTLLEIGRLDHPLQKVVTRREQVLKNLNDEARTLRLNVFTAALEGLRKIDYAVLNSIEDIDSADADENIPLGVRPLGQVSEGYASLPRFWDQVGILYRRNQADQLTPEPNLATGTVPALSSSFRDFSDARDSLPSFDPLVCSGCGQCWTCCPDSAIGATAISTNELLAMGIRVASAENLRMAANKLAARIQNQGRNSKTLHPTAGDHVRDAFDWLKDRMALQDERKQSMGQAAEAVACRLDDLPIAFTETLFHAPERAQKDSGVLLSLAINPDTCKACGLCIEVCAPHALKTRPQTSQHVVQARHLWQTWEQLPDTVRTTLDRLSLSAPVHSAAPIMLSRRCQQSLAGGDGAEAGSGEKIAVRWALAVAEFYRRPHMDGLSAELDRQHIACTELIRKILADALPTGDLDALAEGLTLMRSGQVQLGALTEHLDNATVGVGVDAIRLRRLVNLAKRLEAAHQRLSQGPHGLGQALLSIAVAPGSAATWAGVFPHNPFRVPVAMDLSGETPQLAAGLLEGQLRDTLSTLQLLRKTKLELTRPMEAARTQAETDHLSWEELSPDEEQLCPPLLIIGNDSSLGGQGLSALTWLLVSGLPIKILILSDLNIGLETNGFTATPTVPTQDPKVNLGLFAMAQRQAYVAQTAISNPDHFMESFKAALDFTGPALIHVHTPSPERHGFAPSKTLEQASKAVETRVFPLFRYDPQREGVFGSRIDMAGNPNLDEPWAGNPPLTPADWALTERRFRTHFEPLSEQDPAPLALADYLKLEARDQSGKTPFVQAADIEDEPLRHRVDAALTEVAKERLHGWRTLQELAGRVTPFTHQVETMARQAIAQAHQAELETLKREYEARIHDLETEIALRLQRRLMNLAGYQAVDH